MFDSPASLQAHRVVEFHQETFDAEEAIQEESSIILSSLVYFNLWNIGYYAPSFRCFDLAFSPFQAPNSDPLRLLSQQPGLVQLEYRWKMGDWVKDRLNHLHSEFCEHLHARQWVQVCLLYSKLG